MNMSRKQKAQDVNPDITVARVKVEDSSTAQHGESEDIKPQISNCVGDLNIKGRFHQQTLKFGERGLKVKVDEDVKPCLLLSAGRGLQGRMEGNVKPSVSHSTLQCSWDVIKVLADRVNCDLHAVQNVVTLLDNDNTIPFIARYRKEQTNFMEPDKIRQIKEGLDDLREVQNKVLSVMKKVEKIGKLDDALSTSFLACQTVDDIEHLYAPLKPGGKRKLADRARELGLDKTATELLSSGRITCLSAAVDTTIPGRSTELEVETGVQHIIADIMAKDMQIIELIRQSCRKSGAKLHSQLVKESKTKAAKGASDAEHKTHSTEGTAASQKPSFDRKVDREKFKLYFDFTAPLSTVKPHQVLAINRGEKLKVLKVAIMINDSIGKCFVDQCLRQYLPKGARHEVMQFISRSAEDAYDRLVHPLLVRSCRSELAKMAESESVSVFATNLKKLLLTPPVRGKPILGIDPGFKNGCKFALISATGNIELTGVAYLHTRGTSTGNELEKLRRVIVNYRCETVAIGDGQGCRETEQLMSNAIKQGLFNPVAVMFSIVSEAGASVYSASEEAENELPELDVSVRGAVSIARRLQDPLAELIKIDPKNIGVGMYQHDIDEKKLKTALDGVVEDAVAVVGANLNVASEVLLRHMPGISTKLAAKIVEYRKVQGPFVNRSQLMCVPGIGEKTFEQCAGFLRVMPQSFSASSTSPNNVDDDDDGDGDEVNAAGKRKRAVNKAPAKGAKTKKRKVESVSNLLDATWIHPESYCLAERLLALGDLSKDHIGQPSFITSLKLFISTSGYQRLVQSLQTTEATLKQIVEGLLQPLDADIRDDYEKPLFRRCITSLSDVKVGSILTGNVTNVTNFGAFVNVGVGRDGLIHTSAIYRRLLPAGRTSLEVGDRVSARVVSVDVDRQRIGLALDALGH